MRELGGSASIGEDQPNSECASVRARAGEELGGGEGARGARGSEEKKWPRQGGPRTSPTNALLTQNALHNAFLSV